MFYDVFNFLDGGLDWTERILGWFSVDLTDKAFEVTIDVYFAWFGRVGLCGRWSLLLVSEERFGLNIVEHFDKIFFGLIFTGLQLKFLLKVLYDLIFYLQLVFEVSNPGLHLGSISLELPQYLVEFLCEVLIYFERMCGLSQLIHEEWSFNIIR